MIVKMLESKEVRVKDVRYAEADGGDAGTRAKGRRE